MPSTPFTLRNLQHLLTQIPRGKVTTYAAIAAALGSPRAARAVGTLCARNSEPVKYPCYTVVKSDGSVGKYGGMGIATKIRLLAAEGIQVQQGKVVDFPAKKHVFGNS